MELPIAQNNPRREKLRSSCDGCASSKIRCEKQQPSCSRCQQFSQVCVYGRSRRRGKPVSKLQQPAPEVLQSSIHTFWDQNEALRNSINHIDFSTWQPSNVHKQLVDGCYTDASWEGSDVLAADMTDIGHLSDIFPSLGKLALVATNVVTSNKSSSTNFSVSQSPPGNFSTSSSSNATSLDEDMADCDTLLPEPQSCGNSFCTPKAFTTLSSLYQLAQGEPGNSSQEGLSSNHVLLVAREATQKLEELLSCTCIACTHDPDLFFVLFNIAIKALGWYRSLFNSNISSFSDNIPGGSSFPSSPPKPALTHVEETLYDSPLTVGNLHLPPETELRIRAQLMLCELRPLGQACNTLGLLTRRGDEKGHGEAQIQETLKGHLQRGVKELSRCLEILCVQID